MAAIAEVSEVSEVREIYVDENLILFVARGHFEIGQFRELANHIDTMPELEDAETSENNDNSENKEVESVSEEVKESKQSPVSEEWGQSPVSEEKETNSERSESPVIVEKTIENKFEDFKNNGLYVNELFDYNEEEKIHTIKPDIDFNLYEQCSSYNLCKIALVYYYFYNQNYEKAIEYINDYPISEIKDYWLIRCYHMQGKTKEIINHVKDYAIEDLQDMPKINQFVAHAFFEQFKYVSAEKLLKYLINNTKEYYKENLNMLCEIYSEPDYTNDQEYIKYYEKLIELEPQYESRIKHLASKYFELKDYEKAALNYEESYKLKNDNNVLKELIKCYVHLDDDENLKRCAKLL